MTIAWEVKLITGNTLQVNRNGSNLIRLAWCDTYVTLWMKDETELIIPWSNIARIEKVIKR